MVMLFSQKQIPVTNISVQRLLKIFCRIENLNYCIFLSVDVHEYVHHNKNRIEMTNKMQLCMTIYHSIAS
jgi:hypothetical protein